MFERSYPLRDLVAYLLHGKDAGDEKVIAHGISLQQQCQQKAYSQPDANPAITPCRVLFGQSVSSAGKPTSSRRLHRLRSQPALQNGSLPQSRSSERQYCAAADPPRPGDIKLGHDNSVAVA